MSGACPACSSSAGKCSGTLCIGTRSAPSIRATRCSNGSRTSMRTSLSPASRRRFTSSTVISIYLIVVDRSGPFTVFWNYYTRVQAREGIRMKPATEPLQSLDEWDDFVASRYQEGKSEADFRQYSPEKNPGVAEFY